MNVESVKIDRGLLEVHSMENLGMMDISLGVVAVILLKNFH